MHTCHACCSTTQPPVCSSFVVLFCFVQSLFLFASSHLSLSLLPTLLFFCAIFLFPTIPFHFHFLFLHFFLRVKFSHSIYIFSQKQNPFFPTPTKTKTNFHIKKPFFLLSSSSSFVTVLWVLPLF